jgi:hypothetical protein
VFKETDTLIGLAQGGGIIPVMRIKGELKVQANLAHSILVHKAAKRLCIANRLMELLIRLLV